MKRFLVGLVLGVLFATAGVALASIPDGSGVIHGCYKTADGKLRVIDSATETCDSGETALNWSQAGPQGPAGAAGATGAEGPAGPAGPGLSFTVKQVQVSVPSGVVGDRYSRNGQCDSGSFLISGGWDFVARPLKIEAASTNSTGSPSGSGGSYSTTVLRTEDGGGFDYYILLVCATEGS